MFTTKYAQTLITIVALASMVAVLVGIAMVGAGEAEFHTAHLTLLIGLLTPIITTLLLLVRQQALIDKVDNLQNGLMDNKIQQNVHTVLDQRGVGSQESGSDDKDQTA